jgi:hypothetical protein
LGRILASPDKPQANRITIPICKESRSKTAISGKIDYFATPLPDSKSRAWEFFTGDEFPETFWKHVALFAVLLIRQSLPCATPTQIPSRLPCIIPVKGA